MIDLFPAAVHREISHTECRHQHLEGLCLKVFRAKDMLGFRRHVTVVNDRSVCRVDSTIAVVS